MASRRSFSETPPYYLHVKRTYVEEIDLIPSNHSWKPDEKPQDNSNRNDDYHRKTHRAPSTVPELNFQGSNVDPMASNVGEIDENTMNQLVPSTARTSTMPQRRLTRLDLNLGIPALTDPLIRREPPFQFRDREFRLQVPAADSQSSRQRQLALMPPPPTALGKPEGKTLQITSNSAKTFQSDVPNFQEHKIPRVAPSKVLKIASVDNVNTLLPRAKYSEPLKINIKNVKPLNLETPQLPRAELNKDAVIAKLRVPNKKAAAGKSSDLTEGLDPVRVSLQDSTKTFQEPSSVEPTSKEELKVNVVDQNVPHAELVPKDQVSDSTCVVREKLKNLQKCEVSTPAAVVPDLQPATTGCVSPAVEVEQRVPDCSVVYPPMSFECEKDFYNAKTSLKRQIKEFEAQQQKLQLRLGLSKRQKVPQLHKNFN